jgi:hypothetical protein
MYLLLLGFGVGGWVGHEVLVQERNQRKKNEEDKNVKR